MPVLLDDGKIKQLVDEPKLLPQEYQKRITLKPKSGHKEAELDVAGVNGSNFSLILRQSASNPLDFSVILVYREPKTNLSLRLRRYNGKSHEHRNKLEGDKFYGFHIHQATERYQDEPGLKEDAFAELTNRYGDLDGAVQCMIADCGFQLPLNIQPKLL
jgi:hypothetical protein